MLRTFSAADVNGLIDILRSSEDVTSSELAGMEMLGRLLTHLEPMSDDDIDAEVRRYYRIS